MSFLHLILVAGHYGYDAVVELFVDYSDQLVTHFVLVFVVKAGVVSVGYKVYKKKFKHDSDVSPPGGHS